ncbi:Integrase, catalytic core [Corchorus capsularis]|uniref:Integrase, catalytic core n=1 Tax=Corchorus capsularis TaxID=210143 RepID=A0A1R3HEL8_COCAP|nr:Integrase, catalytic core [Corchorus capsularis]
MSTTTVSSASNPSSNLVTINYAAQLPIKLNSNNYPSWRAQFNSLLLGHKLLDLLMEQKSLLLPPFNLQLRMEQLPPFQILKYKEIVAGIRARESVISYEELMEKMCDYELFLKKQDSATDQIVATAYSTQKQHNNNGNRFKNQNHQSKQNFRPSQSTGAHGTRLTCQFCDKPGHSTKWCRKIKPQKAPMTTNHAAAKPTSHTPVKNTPWIADTGASHHVTTKLEHLDLNTPYDGTDELYVGNGTGLSISHTGSATLNTPHNSFALTDILVDLSTRKPLVQGLNKDGVYEFPPADSLLEGKTLALVGTRQNKRIWHQRLGHPSSQTLQFLVNHFDLPCFKNSATELCTSCACNKIHKLPFDLLNFVTKAPLEILFTDVWGPARIPSPDGIKYHVSFVDYHTRYTWFFPMKFKSDVYSIFPKFKILVERFFKTNILTVFSDCGGEYEKLKSVFSSFGIQHLQTPPHTPENNAVAERKHCSIVETSLTILHNASMPLKFWPYAFQAAVYLVNRLPSKVLSNKSPYESSQPPASQTSVLTDVPVTQAVVTQQPLSIHSSSADANSSTPPPVASSVDNSALPTNEIPKSDYKPKKMFTATKYPLEPNEEPTYASKAVKIPHWKEAMHEELEPLHKNKTWELVPPPSDRNVIGCKWVFRVKKNSDGSISRYKARLVAKGFTQRAGLDYHETFSPVIKHVTVRMVLSIAVSNGWPLQQMDVNNAFLQGELKEEVFMKQPPMFADRAWPHYVCKLQKALYDDILAYMLVYVDDIILTGNNDEFLKKFSAALSSKFSLKDLGHFNYFLGVEVETRNNGIFLSHRKYITDILDKANMSGAKTSTTPMSTTTALTLHDGTASVDAHHFRQILGSLQYLSLTILDISFVKLANPVLTAYSNSDWAGNPDDKRSTSAYVIYLGNTPISWSFKKQKTVAKSSTEAEYKSIAQTVSEITWIKSLMKELHIPCTSNLVIYCDNLSATYTCANPVFHSRMKHLALDYFFVREKVQAGELQVKHISTKAQLADALTKPLSSDRFHQLISKIGVLDQSTILREDIRGKSKFKSQSIQT